MPTPSTISTTALLGTLLMSTGAAVLVQNVIMMSTEHPVTGIIQSCIAVYEQGFSAPSLPPESGRYKYRCTVTLDTRRSMTGLVEVGYDDADPITKTFQHGTRIHLVGAEAGPWRRFRPAGYARDLGSVQLGVILFVTGLALRPWRSK